MRFLSILAAVTLAAASALPDPMGAELGSLPEVRECSIFSKIQTCYIIYIDIAQIVRKDLQASGTAQLSMYVCDSLLVSVSNSGLVCR
jgi:hypothetical protein